LSDAGVRVRFAPSPTGELHVGNARSALFNWLFARGRGGVFVLRIEDTDAVRSSAEHEAAIVADLRWLGLGWDEGIDEGGGCGPYRQSERLGLYREQAERLIGERIAYPCFCAPALLEEERTAQRLAGHVSLYSGRCRGLAPDLAAQRRAAGDAHAIRFDVSRAAPGLEAIAFEDQVRGPIRFPLSQIGDFVLVRRDGTPAYNFAVVVDDMTMRITHVIRGDDHLSNTPRQVLVGRVLGALTPVFAHLPLITAPGGAPLSKREGAVSVRAFREQGYPPEALLNHLALLGWSPTDGIEVLTVEELVARFDLARVTRAPAVFDRQKLDALSLRHVARMPPERLGPLAAEHLGRAGLLPADPPRAILDWAGRVAAMLADRLPRLGAIVEETAILFDFEPGRALGDPDVAATLREPRSRAVIRAALERLGAGGLDAPGFQALAAEVRRLTGAKGRELFHPIRVGLTGRASGPELVRLLPLLDEGSRLDLPCHVRSCAERARALLDATQDDPS
jgi:glutamyl-tRNA synthetase/nondiscriminating glutamyl-tRNA synthetase